MIEFANAVGGESDYLTFGTGEFELTVEEEAKFIESAPEKGHLFLKGEIDREIVSLLNLNRGVRTRVRHIGEFGISVRRPFWGLGVGRLMLGAMIDWSRKVGLRKINLKVRIDNQRAIALYESLGFREEGQLTRAYCTDGEFFDDICMGLALD